jgi:hypothetical protein
MTVTTSLPWWERGAAVVALAVLIGGLAWWAFDFGQLFGHVNGKEIDAKFVALQAEAARLQSDASSLRMRNSQLESDLAMSRGAEQALSRQVADLSADNARLKEEMIVLQRLVADTGKQSGVRRGR